MRRRSLRGRQGGMALVELALILLFGTVLIPAVLLLGRLFWQYGVLQSAVHDAARYLATLPAAEMSNSAQAYAAQGHAQQMVVDGAQAAGMGAAVGPWAVTVQCGSFNCGAGGAVLPASVTVNVQVEVALFSGAVLGEDISSLGIGTLRLAATATQRYGD